MEEPSNAVLYEMIKGQTVHIVEIKDQTKKTNGRVTELEKKSWMIAGGMIVVTIFILPILLDLIKRYLLK